jgi:hypothetical protein
MSILDLLVATVPNLAKAATRTADQRNVLRIPIATPAVKHGALVHDKAGSVTATAAPERVSVFLGPGATFEGLADTLMPLFDAAKAGGGPKAPSIGDLARALIVYNKDRLPTSDRRPHQVGLRLTLPVEVDPGNGDWIVNAVKIGQLAARFNAAWRPRLTTPPAPLAVPDPFVLESDATALATGFPPLAPELWTRALSNPFEVVLLLFAVLREVDRPPLLRAADVALAMLDGATAQQADLLAATSAGNAILRRLAQLLKTMPGADPRLAAAKKLLDDALFDVSPVGLVVVSHQELPQSPAQMVRFGISDPTPGDADDPFGGVHRLVLGRDLAVGQMDPRQVAGVSYLGPEFAGRIALEPYLAADATGVNPADAPRTAALLTVLSNAPAVAALDAVSARGPRLLSVGLDRWSATAVDELPTLLLAFKNTAADEFDLFFTLHGLDVDAPDPAHPLQGRLLKLGIDGVPAPMDPAALQAFLGGLVELDGTISFSPEWAARFRLPALVSRTYRRLQVAQAVARLDRVTPKPKVDSIKPALDVPLAVDDLATVAGVRTFRVTSTKDKVADIEKYEGLSGGDWKQWGKALFTHGKLVTNPADATRFQVPTPMRICYPEDPARPGVVAGAGALPVVLIIHGNHNAFVPIFTAPTTTISKPIGGVLTTVPLATSASVTDIPNHEGYGRLQDLLATVGIISVSINTNFANTFGSFIGTRTRTVIAALDHLMALNINPLSRYRGRLDLKNKIGIVGHSRGGDVAVDVARKLRIAPYDSLVKVKAVCSLAPTDVTGTATDATQLKLTPADTPFYLVVYGSLDGDVHGLGGADEKYGTGFRHYDRATCSKAMVQLSRCCHNRFNSVWSDGNPAIPADPIKKYQGDDQGIKAADLPLLRLFEEHQKLEIEYIGGLFRWQLLNHRSVPDLLDGTRPNRVGVPASLQWSFGSQVKELDDLENATVPTVPGATRTFTVGAREAFPDVTAPKSTIDGGALTTPVAIREHATHRSQVLRVDATAATTSAVAMTLAFPAPVPAAIGPGNWSGFGFLTFRLSYTLDISTLAKFNASPKPKTALKLTDHGGKSRRLPDALAFTTGVPSVPEFHEINTAAPPAAPVLVNATLFRFETVRVPLDRFSSGGGVDLAKVKELVVEFDRAVKTRVLFDSFQLVKR